MSYLKHNKKLELLWLLIHYYLVLCASVWSSRRETSSRRWIFLQFHCGWWSLRPEDRPQVSLMSGCSHRWDTWEQRVVPGTWTEGSPCGKWIPCNQNRVPLCTELGSSLEETAGQNQCTSLIVLHKNGGSSEVTCSFGHNICVELQKFQKKKIKVMRETQGQSE